MASPEIGFHPNIATSEPSILESPPPQGDIFKPADTIAVWLNKIESARSRNEDDQSLVDSMKQSLHEDYVIKPYNIPQRYWNFQARTYIEPGRGEELTTWKIITLDENGNKLKTPNYIPPKDFEDKETNLVIEAQKSSLDKWVNYLTSDGAKHPMWATDWILRGIVGMERLEKNEDEKIIFKQRGKHTTAPFPSPNKQIIEKTIKKMEEELEEQSPLKKGRVDLVESLRINFQDKKSKKLLSPKKFSKLYTEFTNEYSQKILEQTQGEWKHYTDPSADAQALVDSYEGHNVTWCSANIKTAEDNLKNSAYHIYYTPNVEGESTIPRILVRMDDHSGEIVDVRGSGYEQNPDRYIATFIRKILKEKYEEKAEKYQEKAEDMKQLTKLEEKQKNNEDFSSKDLRFLYEINKRIKGFGSDRDPRIQEIRGQRRDFLKDLISALGPGASKKHISFFYDEQPLDRGILYHYGALDLRTFTSLEGRTLPKNVGGNLRLDALTSLKGFTLPEKVLGDIYLPGLSSVKGLIPPTNFEGVINLGNHLNANHPEIKELRKNYPELKIYFHQ